MSNNSPEIVGRKSSFHQLFLNKNLIVEVPIIQRDYAQGRENQVEVRNLFLDALYDYLNKNEPGKDLDFVYGTTEVKDGFVKFIPLDGQQRLTTLFLLHWYLSIESSDYNQFKELMLHGQKSRFTYRTRQSSSDFLNSLLANEIHLQNSSTEMNNIDNSLSATIRNQGWFFLSWSYDPTIQSMLNMLDSIHEKFRGNGNFYKRLTDETAPVITFQYLDLNEFSLTDDIYIKMNSRGKPLTSFENFKAKLEQQISSLFWEDKKPFSVPLNDLKLSYRDYFSFQIDTTWAKLFWNYRHLIGNPNTFDEEFMNFIRIIISSQFAIDNSEGGNTFKELVKNESATSELTENLSFYKFQSLKSLTKNFVVFLIDGCDVLVNGNNGIKNYLTEKFYFDENDIFEKALRYNLSLPERALLHAYLRFLIIHKKDRSNIFQWMRVIHNLVENTRIEEPDNLVSAIKSIEKLLPYSSDILRFLSGAKCKIDFFSSWQVEEEKLKAHLIVKSEDWKQVIEMYEKLIFHKGQLMYLFEFSDVLSYYNRNGDCDWSDGKDRIHLQSFKRYASASVAFFGITDTKKNKEYIVERALLSKGDYLIPASNFRCNFCSSKSVGNYQRDYSWKRLLRFTIEDVDFWMGKRTIVKNLFDDRDFNSNDVEKALYEICRTVPTDWRKNFITDFELIDYCGQGFIRRIEEDGDDFVELLGESQLNHYHIEMDVYHLYLSILRHPELSKPFNSIKPVSVKNSDDYSFILLEDWCYKKKYYCIKIYHDESFIIEFEKERGLKDQSEFSKDIIEVLQNNKFKWDDDYNAYYIKKDSESSTIVVLRNLLLKLDQL